MVEARVNIGKGKSAFDKKPLGELFGNKNVFNLSSLLFSGYYQESEGES